MRGVRTAVLAERGRAGAPVDELADEFHLAPRDVRDGLTFEWSTVWTAETAA